LSEPEITRLLVAWKGGDAGAGEQLLPLVYGELRRIARGQRRRLASGDTLSTTALVNEVYLKLADSGALRVQDRGHFFAIAATAMRQLLVDAARRRGAAKRGGPAHHTDLPSTVAATGEPRDQVVDVLALDAAMSRLADLDPRLVRLVELRFFAGLSVEETADAMELSPRTVKRDWQKARLFLYHQLSSEGAT